MAVFTAVNFLAMRLFARVNNVITWWKVAVPILAIIVLLFEFDPGNFTAGGAGLFPGRHQGPAGALPLSGIIFAYFGFEQADQLAGEIKNPGRNLPRAIIVSILHRHRDLRPAADRRSLVRCPRARSRTGSSTSPTQDHHRGAVRRGRGPGRARVAGDTSCGSTRSSPRPAPA